MKSPKEPLKKTVTFTGEYVEKNFTVFDIQNLKGKRQLSQTLPSTPEESTAAEQSGIDWLNVRYDPQNPKLAEQIRKSAPNTFMTFAMPAKNIASKQTALKLAFEAMEMGADSIMCSTWSLEHILALANAGVPAQGHVGLVPRRSTWTGGLRAVGKTFDQSKKIFGDIKALEEVGAWAVEVEVVPSAVLEAITKKTNLVTCSIGSGGGGDVQFLFAEDILGDSLNPFPRHSKQYCNLIKIREEMQELRKIAFSQFNAEVKNGSFPSKQFEVSSSEEELKKLTDYLSNFQ
jgi:3-methyl-2-oxobutanoate hydroxymethyltransferase